VIQVKNLRYHYPDTGWVLEGVNLAVNRGEYLAILGANGSGKSTLAYLLNGLIPHFFGGTLEGTVFVDGIDTRDCPVSDLVTRVGLVLQNADAQLFNSTVEQEIVFGLESLGMPRRNIEQRLRQITEALHLEHLLARSPMTLSGGEKRLVAIGSVLALDPSVLVLDEPYGDLDWEATARVRRSLKNLHVDGKTLVVVEQRLEGVLGEGVRCLVVGDGRICFDGPSKEAAGALLGERLVPRYPERRRRDQSAEPLVAVRDLSYRVGEHEVLKGVTLDIRAGETVALVGRNGSGKTTLIKHFNGLLRPTAGTVAFQGRNVRSRQMAAQVGLSFQNPNDQFFRYRVRDELEEGPRRLGKLESAWFQEISDIFDLHGLLDRSPYRLSEGEKKRIAVASILTVRPPLLVLDEPTIGQDGRLREALAVLLTKLTERGCTTVIATHDLEFAQAVAERWIVLHDGKVVADGSPEELWCDERVLRLGALGRLGDKGWANVPGPREERYDAA
jgi:energy-coupling factor transporter ATP-binding protein EcfA2